MTTATLAMNDARLRGGAVNSAADLVRIQLERNAHSVGLCFYLALAHYQFRRFKSVVEHAYPCELRDPALVDLGDAFTKHGEMIHGRLRRMRNSGASLWFAERCAFRGAESLATVLRDYGTELHDRAARGERPPLRTPKLTGRLAYQAGMASLFLKPVARDKAEDLPDPDYGI